MKKYYNYSQLHVLFEGDFFMSRKNKDYSTELEIVVVDGYLIWTPFKKHVIWICYDQICEEMY